MKQAESDAIRREVAFTVMDIVKALLERKTKALRTYQNYLPTYEMRGCSNSIINRYFCPLTLESKGKRRVYVNKNGFYILYFSKKAAKKLALNYMYGLSITNCEQHPVYKQIVEAVADKWIISKSCSGLTKWDRFGENVVSVETTSSKDNHPPCGSGKFNRIDLLLPTGILSDFNCGFNRNAMTEIYLTLCQF